MLLDYIRQIHASKSFKIADTFELQGFEDMTSEGLTDAEPVPDQLDVWATVKLSYTGEVPDSYKALNLIISDWVVNHEPTLTKMIHTSLLTFLAENYAGHESEVNDEDTAIWLDQLEYMPRVDPDTKTIIIEIELVLLAEQIEE
jgi:hypothetical protein